MIMMPKQQKHMLNSEEIHLVLPSLKFPAKIDKQAKQSNWEKGFLYGSHFGH